MGNYAGSERIISNQSTQFVESRWQMCRLQMSDPNREGISRIMGWFLSQSQQRFHHEGHLLFVGGPLADDGQLDPFRSVFVNFQTSLHCGKNRGSTGGSENDRRFIALHINDGFNRTNRRLKFSDNFLQRLVDGQQTSALTKLRMISNHAKSECFDRTFPGRKAHAWTGWMRRFQHSVAGIAQGRIDAKHAQRHDLEGSNLLVRTSDAIRAISPC